MKTQTKKASKKIVAQVFLATLKGSRLLFDAKLGKSRATVPATTSVGEFAAAHGFEIVARSVASKPAVKAYVSAWRAEHRATKSTGKKASPKHAKKA